jgi:hypothetical protein
VFPQLAHAVSPFAEFINGMTPADFVERHLRPLAGRLEMHLHDFLFAWLYERALLRAEAAGLRAIRRELFAGARGRILEIGAGTGLNLGHYAGAMSRHQR